MMCGFSCVKKAACILSYFLISIIQHLKESNLFLKILHLHSVVQSSYKLLLAHQVMYLILTQAETGWTLDTHQCPSRRSEIIVPLFSELLWTITGKPEHSIASGPKRFVGQSKSNTAQEGHSPSHWTFASALPTSRDAKRLISPKITDTTFSDAKLDQVVKRSIYATT